jgi:hypothetical protein
MDQSFDVEIDQKTDPPVEQLEISEQLGPVDRFDGLDRLHFDDDALLDQQIDPVAIPQRDALVGERELPLLFPSYPTQRQFVSQTA